MPLFTTGLSGGDDLQVARIGVSQTPYPIIQDPQSVAGQALLDQYLIAPYDPVAYLVGRICFVERQVHSLANLAGKTRGKSAEYFYYGLPASKLGYRYSRDVDRYSDPFTRALFSMAGAVGDMRKHPREKGVQQVTYNGGIAGSSLASVPPLSFGGTISVSGYSAATLTVVSTTNQALTRLAPYWPSSESEPSLLEISDNSLPFKVTTLRKIYDSLPTSMRLPVTSQGAYPYTLRFDRSFSAAIRHFSCIGNLQYSETETTESLQYELWVGLRNNAWPSSERYRHWKYTVKFTAYTAEPYWSNPDAGDTYDPWTTDVSYPKILLNKDVSHGGGFKSSISWGFSTLFEAASGSWSNDELKPFITSGRRPVEDNVIRFLNRNTHVPNKRALDTLREFEGYMPDLRSLAYYTTGSAVQNAVAINGNDWIETCLELTEGFGSLLPSPQVISKILKMILKPKSLLKDPAAVGDILSSLFLYYSFGGKPNAEALHELRQNKDSLSERFSSLSELVGHGTIVSRPIELAGQAVPVTVRSKVIVPPSSGTLASAILGGAGVGFMPSFSSLWNVTPFSFAVDWLFDISSKLSAADSLGFAMVLKPSVYVHTYSVDLEIAELLALYDLEVLGEDPKMRVFRRETSVFYPTLRSQALLPEENPEPFWEAFAAIAWSIIRS